MTAKLSQSGLSRDTIHNIQQALATFPEINRAILYGSRAKGNYRNGSDIDLALNVTTANSHQLLLNVMDAMDNLDTPYSLDISIKSQISNPDLLAHIERVGIEFYNKKQFKT